MRNRQKRWPAALIFIGAAAVAVGAGVLVHRLTRPDLFARIAEADRVVVFGCDEPEHGKTYTGVELSRLELTQIIKVIQNSRRGSAQQDSPVDSYSMHFYKEKVRIAILGISGNVFLADRKYYHDSTGTLSRLIDRVLEKQHSGMMTKKQADRLVQQLKKSLPGPADSTTRERIAEAIHDFTRKGGVTVNGEWKPYSTKASHEIIRIGQVALPQLIDAAANHESASARKFALVNIKTLHNIKAGGDRFFDLFGTKMRRFAEVPSLQLGRLG